MLQIIFTKKQNFGDSGKKNNAIPVAMLGIVQTIMNNLQLLIIMKPENQLMFIGPLFKTIYANTKYISI